MMCDIIIPIWNQLELTRQCIDHIEKNTRYPCRLILVDNGSNNETRFYLENLENKKNVSLIRNKENLGFVKAVNQGLKISKAPYVCVLNNDTLPGEGWLRHLIDFAQKHKDAGLLNPLCKGHEEKNVSINEYARSIASNKDRFMEMNQCQGFSMLIRRELIEKIGYLDEQFGIGGFDDTDYSLRAHLAGYKSVCVYSSYVYHKEHESFREMGDRKKIQSESERRFFKKWPRHLRIAIFFSVKESTSDREIANLLKSALFLARGWCWVNLFIVSKKPVKDRLDMIGEATGFPLHQNIKITCSNPALEINSNAGLYYGFKTINLMVRILERCFGRKRRKKYDIVIHDNVKISLFMNAICAFGKCRLSGVDFNTFPENKLKSIIPVKNLEAYKCDIILPVCDQYEFTKNCVESIMKNTDTPYRLIVINNGTNPDTKKLLDDLEKNREIETTIMHNTSNIGWVKALNKGIELLDAPYVCFQNDDTIVTGGWLRKMIDTLSLSDKFGMINPSWEGRPGSVSIEDYNRSLENSGKKLIETDWCRGFSVVIKRSVVEKIGKVDEIYGLAYFDDVDYSVTAIEAGFLCLKALDTYVYHCRNVTFFEVLKGKRWNELHEKNKLIYYKKWGKPLKIAIILDKEICKDTHALDQIEKTLFNLARKQHHIYLWSPKRFESKFQHTNIKVKTFHPLLLKFIVSTDLYCNKRKRPEKRYSAVFNYGKNAKPDDLSIIEDSVNGMKEKTKELVNV